MYEIERDRRQPRPVRRRGVEEHERRGRVRHHNRRHLLPDRGRHHPHHHRSARRLLFARVRQLRTKRRQRAGPVDPFEHPRRGNETLQRGGGVHLRGRDVDVADQLRIPRGRLPALVAAGQAHRKTLVGGDAGQAGFGLKQHVRQRQLAIEIERERIAAGGERCGHALPLRGADPPQPAVLQRREQHDQSEQGGRDGHRRRPEPASHGTSLHADSGRKLARTAGFTSLTISLPSLNHWPGSNRHHRSSAVTTSA